MVAGATAVRRGVAVLLVLACLQCAALSAVAQDSVQVRQARVAVMVPLSGDLGPMGQQLLEVAQLAAAEHDVEVVAIDEGQGARDVVRSFEQIQADPGVVAVVGLLRPGHGPVAAREAGRIGVPTIIYSTREEIDGMSPWAVRGRMSAAEQTEQLAVYLGSQSDVRRVAVMAPRTPRGDDLVATFLAAAGSQSLTVAAMSRYDEGTTDFGPILDVLVGRRASMGRGRSVGGRGTDRQGTMAVRPQGTVGFEALAIFDYHDEVARILPFLPRAGIRTGATDEGASVRLLGLSNWRGDGLARAGDHGAGAVFFDTYAGAEDGSDGAAFAMRFVASMGREATTAEAEFYDLVNWTARIASGAQGERREVLRQLRGGSGYRGVTGHWAFDDRGSPVRQLRQYQVTPGGQWVRIDRGDDER